MNKCKLLYVQLVPAQTSDVTNAGPGQMLDFSANVGQDKRQAITNVGLRKKLFYDFFKKVISFYRLQSNKNLPKGTEFLPSTPIFSSLNLCNLITVLTSDTLKLFAYI